jgi:hypothetical protein
MAWVIANTSKHNPKLYAFDMMSEEQPKEWELVKIESAEFLYNDYLILTPETLSELSAKGVAVFEKKSSAREDFKRLSISNCKYIELKLPITLEYRRGDIS